LKLAELISGVEHLRVRGGAEIEIAGLSYDSRRTNAGDLFFSTARDPSAARAHIDQAFNRGARAVVMRSGVEELLRSAVTVIECERPRLLMGVAAARFFNAPSRRLDLIGITGTSGKTTTTYLLRSIFEAAGVKAGIIGTIGILASGYENLGGLTTPEAIDLEAALAVMEQSGVRAVAAEISSIGLEEGRCDQLSFRAAVFTNLGRDHLDYHGSSENYFAAKLRLFTELLPTSSHPAAIAAVNGDDPHGATVLDQVHGDKISFGMGAGNDVRPLDASFGTGGVTATIVARGQRLAIESPLLGEINLRNILGASAVSVALGIEADAVVEGVRRCPGAPGRLEAVSGPPGVTVLVDYAHKPDALLAILETLRALEPRRLICVFGCGGDRDRGKRPIMGEIAGRLADVAIITSDNPRSEDPTAIIAAIESGMRQTALRPIGEASARGARGYIIEPDRREGIAIALRVAERGDIIVIAGKGHEDYQLIGGRKLDFDDRVVVRELTSAMLS
jgi:UDP-N-acetylmuramoyl-L-alanyl-D-glutamate--2,6-diaminopimelate ligase